MIPNFINAAQEKGILDGVGKIAGWVQTWAVPLAAIGTVSMALLQTAKNVFRMRSRFQKRYFGKWLRDNSPSVDDALQAKWDLIGLAASGDEEAFFDLPIEQMCSQIKGISPVLLDYPEEHVALLLCLAKRANPEDIKCVLSPPPLELHLKRPDQHTHEEKLLVRAYAAAKTRVAAQVRCTVDAVQTSIGFRWKYTLQVASLS